MDWQSDPSQLVFADVLSKPQPKRWRQGWLFEEFAPVTFFVGDAEYEMYKYPVTTKSRKLKAKWTVELEQDVEHYHSAFIYAPYIPLLISDRVDRTWECPDDAPQDYFGFWKDLSPWNVRPYVSPQYDFDFGDGDWLKRVHPMENELMKQMDYEIIQAIEKEAAKYLQKGQTDE